MRYLQLVIVCWLCASITACGNNGTKPISLDEFEVSKEIKFSIDGEPRFKIQVITFVRLVSGETIVPCTLIEKPHFGTLDITTKWEAQDPLSAVGAGDPRDLEIPVRDDIEAYIFLINDLNSDTDWRYFEVAQIDLKESHVIVIPGLATLKSLNEVPDGGTLWVKYEEAADKYNRRP